MKLRDHLFLEGVIGPVMEPQSVLFPSLTINDKLQEL